jgi:hypothetical protein
MSKLGLPRTRLIELIVAISVVVISVASLFVAVFQGMVIQRTMEANVMPIVTYNHSNFDAGTQTGKLSFLLVNRRLGPAQIEWVSFEYEGERNENLYRLLLACCTDQSLPTIEEREAALMELTENEEIFFVTRPTNRQLIAQGEPIEFFAMPDPNSVPAAEAIWSELNDARWETEVEVCYCSVFDQCWLARFPEGRRDDVRSCEIE